MAEVNDEIFDVLVEMGSEDGEVLCECSNVDCIETIPLRVKEYEELRQQPERPILKLRGHPG